jgi:hypothetical protein
VTVYEASGADGRLEPRWPEAGPCAAKDERPCRLRRSHWRARKTGPGGELQVASCGVHGRGFTLYPPGHVPYARRRVAPVASDGAPVAPPVERRPMPGPEPATRTPAVRRFEGTWFEAAIDAAEGRAWPRGSPGDSELRWETQRRALVRQAAWLGVGADLPDDRREAVAAALDVPVLLLRDAARAIAKRRIYRSRGTAVCAVLRALCAGGRLYERLVGAAHAAGRLGLMLRWDARSRSLHPPPSFRFPGTRAPPRQS